MDAALLLVQQLDRLALDQGLACKTFDELVPRYHADIRAGPLYDTGDDSTHTQLLRKGRVMAGAARAAAKQQLLRFLERMPQAGWGAEVPARGLQLHQFPMAHKGGDEILWAKSCGGTRTRCSWPPLSASA